MKSILTLVTALLLAGCAGTATEEKKEATKAPDAKADLDALNKLREDFITAFNAGDAMKIGDIYAESAMALPGDGTPTVVGRSAIIARNKALFEQFTGKITITPSRNAVSGDLGYDQGTYTLELTPKAKGKAITESGRYLVVAHREADGWKLIEDIDNAVKPPAPAAKK